MSKIIYHQNCHKHEFVKKAKRMLNQIEQEYGVATYQGNFYCSITLTGINDLDRMQVKMYVETHLKELKRKIDKQLLQNEKLVNGDWNENYEEGYYMPSFKVEFELAEALNKVYNFIYSNYPEIEFKESVVFVFNQTSNEAKYNALKEHINTAPVFGFNRQYYGIMKDGSPKQFYGLSFSPYDLTDVIAVNVKYQ